MHMPDFSFGVTNAVNVHCVYISDAILSKCLMLLLLFNMAVEVHCVYIGCHFVYMPDVIVVQQKQWKCIVSIFRMSFCLYAGCQVCSNKCREDALCLYSGCQYVYMPDVTFAEH